MLPSTLVMLVAGPWAGRIAVRANSRLPLVLGAVFGALAFVFYAVAHDEVWQIAFGGVLLGIGIGFSFSSMANLVVESVPRDEVGVATGINTIMRSLGGALGAQLVATLLTTQTIGNPPIPTEAAYTDAFIVAAIAAALAVVAALMIPWSAPRRSRSRRQRQRDRALGVQARRVVDRHGRVLRADEQVDLGAAEQDGLRAALDERADDRGGTPRATRP